jgi:hypothetical protein
MDVELGVDGWLRGIGDFGLRRRPDGRKLQMREAVSRVSRRVQPEIWADGTRNILRWRSLLLDLLSDNTNDGAYWDIRLHHFTD